MISLSVLEAASEAVHYENPKIPIYVNTGRLSGFANMEVCHWHDDIEYIKAVKGHMTYSVNGRLISIEENDALIVNSKQLHYSFSIDRSECEFYRVLFKPQILCSNEEIYNKYIMTVTNHPCITEDYLSSGNMKDSAIIGLFDYIFSIYRDKRPGYELEALGNLYLAWVGWLNKLGPQLNSDYIPTSKDADAQRKMVQFIQDNYRNKVTLNEIASAGGVCRSKCCQIFKKHLNRSPMEFLNIYRLGISMDLLKNTTYSITEIAYTCGFNSPSYFAEIFCKLKGCTPSGYRGQQNNIAED